MQLEWSAEGKTEIGDREGFQLESDCLGPCRDSKAFAFYSDGKENHWRVQIRGSK